MLGLDPIIFPGEAAYNLQSRRTPPNLFFVDAA